MYGDSQADVPGERDGHLSVLQARQRGYTCSSSPKVTNQTSIEIGGKFNTKNFVESLLNVCLLCYDDKNCIENLFVNRKIKLFQNGNS